MKGHKAGKIVVSEPAAARRLLAEKLNVETFDPTGKSVEECIEALRALSPDNRGFHHTFDCSGFQLRLKQVSNVLELEVLPPM